MCTVQHEAGTRTASADDLEFVREMTGHTRETMLSLVRVKDIATMIMAGDVDGRMTGDERRRCFDHLRLELLDLFVVVTKLDDEIRFVHDSILDEKETS